MSYNAEMQYNNAELEEILKTVEELPEAGSGTSVQVKEKDVNFWDYDGTLLYSYTLDELQELTELPPNANHEGLVGEGWNWTLEGLKENNGPLDVAALYVTEDEATWFDFENNFNRNVEVTFLWNQSEKNGARIDFGDGSEPYITVATGDLSVKHVYQPGTYRAKIHGTYTLKGTNTSCCVNDILACGSSLLKRVYIGKIDTIGAYAFKSCILLESYSLPNYCYLNGVQIFYNCHSLKFCYTSRRKSFDHSVASSVFAETTYARVVSFGDNTKSPYSTPPQIKRAVFASTLSLNSTVFANNHVLKDVKIWSSTTAIASRAFQNCYSLTEITVSASVTTINAYAFAGVNSLRCLRFEGTTPPTVANANAFDIPDDCIVEVPAESLEAYQNATNYGTIAAQMVGV